MVVINTLPTHPTTTTKTPIYMFCFPRITMWLVAMEGGGHSVFFCLSDCSFYMDQPITSKTAGYGSFLGGLSNRVHQVYILRVGPRVRTRERPTTKCDTRVPQNMPEYTRVAQSVHEYPMVYSGTSEYTRFPQIVPEYPRLYPE